MFTTEQLIEMSLEQNKGYGHAYAQLSERLGTTPCRGCKLAGRSESLKSVLSGRPRQATTKTTRDVEGVLRSAGFSRREARDIALHGMRSDHEREARQVGALLLRERALTGRRLAVQ